MHILIAPDSFKESLSASEVAKAIQKGFQKALPEATFDRMPIGDGGEGTLAALAEGLHLESHSHTVTGALGQAVQAHYATNGHLAVFEMADICGLEKVPLVKRNPLTLTTEGVGEMLAHLIDLGITDIMVGVGGSSTNDGGLGMAAGLGYHFFDEAGQELAAIGDNLGNIVRFFRDSNSPDLSQVTLTIITDVTNPLCGPKGATYIFAGQKGLPKTDFAHVDKAMEQFYRQSFPEFLDLAGAGAGGGMAAGLVAFAGGKIISGIDAVLDVLDFDRRVQAADLVIVGEGRMDQQSLSGKAPVGVARRTPKGTLVIAICGSLKDDLPDFPVANIQAAFPIISGVDSLEKTLAKAPQNLERTAQNIGNLLALTDF
ncbi:glycerate kinase [Streptococcus alactolyticus]|uniref:Glycerate kinase n=1 Tax=Streptococcus alactolyticus TaxID=29389 RepID=A0A6N7WM61_STRAY|nr:glycerate kinase [Streptococcus alactolyticus]MST53010.1 glycerate kinase [Streptococcus alactolyticus]